MANIKSAIKRIDTTKRQTLENKKRKSEIKTYERKFHDALEAGDTDQARETLKIIDKKVKRASLANIIHPNAASRKISQLQKKLNTAVNA